MTQSRLPNRLLSPLWRAKNYIELNAGMPDPAYIARKERERKASTAPTVVQEKIIRIGGGGGSGSDTGVGTFVLKTGDTMAGDLGISKPNAALTIESTNAGNSQIAIYDTTDGGVLLFGINGGGNLARSSASGTWVENILGFDNTGFLTINPDGADQDLRVMGDVDPNVLYVDASTDRVGIGTAAPTQKLHVNGGIQIASTNRLYLFNTSYWIRASSGLELNTLDTMSLEVGGAERFRVTDTLITAQTGMTINGSVNIENGDLSVNKYGGTPTIMAKSQVGAGFNPAFLNVARWGLGGIATPNNEYVGALWFTGLNSSNTFAGFSKIECGVGVNTVSGPPTYLRLTSVITNVEDAAITLDSRAATPYIGLNENVRNVDTIIRGDIDTFLLFADASQDRIGMGTNAPVSKLHVVGAVTCESTNDGLTIASSAGQQAQLNYRDGGILKWIVYKQTDNDFSIYNVALGIDIMTFSAGGNITVNPTAANVDLIVHGDNVTNLLYVDASVDRVGIGTATPSQRFEVIGASRFTLNGTAAIAVNAPTAGQVGEISFEDAAVRKWAIQKTSLNELGIFDLTIGNTVLLTPGATGSLFLNASSAARDTIIRGDTDTNLLFVDASTDRVGIGMSNPQYKLDVTGVIRAFANGVGLRISTVAPTNQAELWFDEAASAKWALYKDTANNFAIYNAALSRNDVFIDRTNGAVTLANLVGSGTRVVGATNAGLLTTTGISIDALQDVAITAPLNGDLLTFNGTVWVNSEPQQGIITLDDRTHVYASKFGTTGSGSLNFNAPNQITIDAGGNIYVADFGNNRVTKYTSAGAFVWSEGATGVTGVTVDTSGNIYALGFISPNGYISSETSATVFRWFVNINGVTPRHIATDSTYLYVTCSDHKVRKFFCSDGALAATWGTTGAGDGQFNTPVGIAHNSNFIFVVDQGNDRVQVFTVGGVFVTKWGRTGSDPGEFQLPYGIVVNNTNGHVLVSDQVRDDVQEFTFEGGYIGEFGSAGTGNGNFQSATGLAPTTDGASMWVADSTQNRLQKFTVSLTTESAISIAMNPEDFIVASDPTTVGQAYISLITPAKSLAALDDVTVTQEQAGEGLVFNGANWVNTPVLGVKLFDESFVASGTILRGSIFSSLYRNYTIIVNLDQMSAANNFAYFRLYSTAVGINSSAIYTLNSAYIYTTGGATAAVASYGSSGASLWNVFPQVAAGTWVDSILIIRLANPFLAKNTAGVFQLSGVRSGYDWIGLAGMLWHGAAVSYDGFVFGISGGTWTGQIKVFGEN